MFILELASDLFSEFQQGQSLNLLYCDDVADISRKACVSPCSLVLALLYLERLKQCNVEYLRCVDPSKLFLISLVCLNMGTSSLIVFFFANIFYNIFSISLFCIIIPFNL